jgi:hypothetical protein
MANVNVENLLNAVEAVGIAYGVNKLTDANTSWVDYRTALLQAAANCAEQEISDIVNQHLGLDTSRVNTGSGVDVTVQK